MYDDSNPDLLSTSQGKPKKKSPSHRHKKHHKQKSFNIRKSRQKDFERKDYQLNGVTSQFVKIFEDEGKTPIHLQNLDRMMTLLRKSSKG